MRTYLEALEIVAFGQDAEFVRLDVTSKTEAERAAILVALKDVMTGITCTFSRHDCRHDTYQLCAVEEV